jgi:hypothetical protein
MRVSNSSDIITIGNIINEIKNDYFKIEWLLDPTLANSHSESEKQRKETEI